jgi:hypothetical protein
MLSLTLLVALQAAPADFAAYPARAAPAYDGTAAYTRAVQLMDAQQYFPALELLNEVALRQPGFAEAFAARCTAHLKVLRPELALADCRYALSLKPSLSPALLGLATAESALGQRREAAQHFRDYAQLNAPEVTAELRARALFQADQLQPSVPLPAPSGWAVATARPAAPAPTVSVGVSFQAGSAARAPATGPGFCHSSIDCPGGGFCKDRGDGLKVCMDNGGEGASCHSSIDCGGGGFCKDRGDGLKVCMDHGVRGGFCQSSIDCGGSLFCKDRGDGLKVCR